MSQVLVKSVLLGPIKVFTWTNFWLGLKEGVIRRLLDQCCKCYFDIHFDMYKGTYGGRTVPTYQIIQYI